VSDRNQDTTKFHVLDGKQRLLVEKQKQETDEIIKIIIFEKTTIQSTRRSQVPQRLNCLARYIFNTSIHCHQLAPLIAINIDQNES
jgi:hypothetical protein